MACYFIHFYLQDVGLILRPFKVVVRFKCTNCTGRPYLVEKFIAFHNNSDNEHQSSVLQVLGTERVRETQRDEKFAFIPPEIDV